MKPNKLNKLYDGDCIDYLSNKLLFPDNSINLIMTSPPYSDRRKGSYGGVHPDKYVQWFIPIAIQLYRVLKSTGSFVLNIKENVRNGERETYVLELILEMRKKGWLWTEEYCWYKKNSYPGKWPNRFRDSWERCIHFTKNKKFNMYQDAVRIPIGDWAKPRFKSMSEKDFIRYMSKTNSKFGRNVSNWLGKRKVYPHNVLIFENEHYFDNETVVNLATECSNRNHSAVFPIELPSWFIKLFTRAGDVVLDPFMGVGTTALAAMALNRRYVGIESSKLFLEEAERNIQELKQLIGNDQQD
jgi:DNA modification methylase